jgi:hypothetical protein
LGPAERNSARTQEPKTSGSIASLEKLFEPRTTFPAAFKSKNRRCDKQIGQIAVDALIVRRHRSRR